MKTSNLSKINTIEDLLEEQRTVKLRIKQRERALQSQLQKLPGELIKTGIAAAIPAFLTGKATTAGLNTAGKLVNFAFSKIGDRDAGGLFKAAKQVGLFTLLRLAYKNFVQKRRWHN